MILPNGCQLHVEATPSGNRWHAWCDCGWNQRVDKFEKGHFTTRATEKEAIVQAIWHARKPIREQAKLDIAAKVNGASTTPSRHPRTV